MGLSPPKHPKNPYIRGDTGGGRGYPHHIGGYMGGLTIILGFPLPYSLLYYIPMALPTTTSARIQITNRVKALNGLFMLWGFLIVIQIYGNISILPKKRKGTIVPLPLLVLALQLKPQFPRLVHLACPRGKYKNFHIVHTYTYCCRYYVLLCLCIRLIKGMQRLLIKCFSYYINTFGG
jgi:hypothetical protein